MSNPSIRVTHWVMYQGRRWTGYAGPNAMWAIGRLLDQFTPEKQQDFSVEEAS